MRASSPLDIPESADFVGIPALAMKALLLAGLVASLGACGALPVPYPSEWEDPEPFKGKDLAPIVIGETTRSKVRDYFSSWTYQFKDETVQAIPRETSYRNGKYWLYSLSGERSRWSTCWIFVWMDYPLHFPDRNCLPPQPAGVRVYHVLIEFDQRNIVSNLWLTHEGMPCVPGSACVHGEQLTIMAAMEVDRATKRILDAGGNCGIYLFTGSELPYTVSISLDGVEAGALVDEDNFNYWTLAPGPHELTVGTPDWYGSRAVDATPGWKVARLIECMPGRSIYIKFTGERTKSLDELDGKEGKRAIEEKYLVRDSMPRPDS